MSSSPAKVLLAWPMRILIYSLAVFISFGIILPALGGLFGLLVGALVAAAAMALETFCTSRLNQESIEHTAVRRMMLVDRVMSTKDQPELDAPQHQRLEEAEVVSAEVLEEPQHRELNE